MFNKVNGVIIPPLNMNELNISASEDNSHDLSTEDIQAMIHNQNNILDRLGQNLLKQNTLNDKSKPLAEAIFTPK